MNSSNIHIGNLIREAWLKSGLSASVFAAEIGQARQNMRHVLARESMDSELLFKISLALKEDFFAEYSQALPWSGPRSTKSASESASNPELEMQLKIKTLELESAKREIEYLKEIVGLLKGK